MQQEELLQTICVNWFKCAHPELTRLLVHVPNERKCTPQRGAALRGMGVVAGVADLILFVASGGFHGLCVEMKTEKGRQRDSQKEWQAAVEGQGYQYKVCRSVQDFQEVIGRYLID